MKLSPLRPFLPLLLAACGGGELELEPAGQLSSEARAEPPDLIECRADDQCPRGSSCDAGLGFCFTPTRCVVGGRPSDRLCAATYGEGFVCFEYGPGSHHCVPTAEERLCRAAVDCRRDDQCPRGARCEAGLGICSSSSRCVVDGRPSHRFCAATFGDDFLCLEYAADSWHCAPFQVEPCR